jgi:hypothetical protein
LIRVFVTAFLTLLGSFSLLQPSTVGSTPAYATANYVYDSADHAVWLNDTTSERGPPAEYDRPTDYDAVDRWSHGTSARPSGRTTATIQDYDDIARFVQSARGSRLESLRWPTRCRSDFPTMGLLLVADI